MGAWGVVFTQYCSLCKALNAKSKLMWYISVYILGNYVYWNFMLSLQFWLN